jgi:hypothetical protein
MPAGYREQARSLQVFEDGRSLINGTQSAEWTQIRKPVSDSWKNLSPNRTIAASIKMKGWC